MQGLGAKCSNWRIGCCFVGISSFRPRSSAFRVVCCLFLVARRRRDIKRNAKGGGGGQEVCESGRRWCRVLCLLGPSFRRFREAPIPKNITIKLNRIKNKKIRKSPKIAILPQIPPTTLPPSPIGSARRRRCRRSTRRQAQGQTQKQQALQQQARARLRRSLFPPYFAPLPATISKYWRRQKGPAQPLIADSSHVCCPRAPASS
jgi:hypothetical protein